MEDLKVENFGNNESIREILGFFHHRLSQQEKDIGLINRRIGELIQKSKSSEQSTVQAFIETSNCRLDTFAASIKSVTDQMVQLTMPNQIHYLNKSRDNLNEFKNDVKEEIGQISIEIDFLKSQISRISEENKFNENSIENESIEKVKTKQKPSKKGKNKKRKFESISIFDIKPAQNNQINQKSEIEFITNEINQIKKKISNQFETSNQKFIHVNKRIDDLESKLNISIQESASKKVGFNFHSKNEIENPSEKVCNYKNIETIEISSDSLDSCQVSDLDLKNRVNRKEGFGTISSFGNSIRCNNDSCNVIDKKKSFSSTAKLSTSKNGPSKMQQNATPRKASAHYTLINGYCLKRPGSQMVQKKIHCMPSSQKLPL